MAADGLTEEVRDLLHARSAYAGACDVLELVPPGAGLLLVGSYAAGVAHSRSDLDFVLLLEDDEVFEPPAALVAAERRSTFSRDVLVDLGGIALHFEVVHASALTALRGPARDMEAAGRGTIPLLQLLEVRFLIRLRDGAEVRGAERIRAWRDDLGVAALPDFLVAINLEAAAHHLENAFRRVVEEDDDLTGLILTRLAVEAIVEAALAACGVLTIDLKQVPRRAAALHAEGRAVPDVLLHLPDVLVPHPDLAGQPYLELVHGYLRDLYAFIVRHRQRAAATAPLHRLAERDDARLDWTFVAS